MASSDEAPRADPPAGRRADGGARSSRPADGDAGDWLSRQHLARRECIIYGWFRQGLSETGYVEGRDVAIEYRWAEGRYDRLAALAADLVERKVDVIAAGGSYLGSGAAKNATS